jgi:hypothetical protein
MVRLPACPEAGSRRAPLGRRHTCDGSGTVRRPRPATSHSPALRQPRTGRWVHSSVFGPKQPTCMRRPSTSTSRIRSSETGDEVGDGRRRWMTPTRGCWESCRSRSQPGPGRRRPSRTQRSDPGRSYDLVVMSNQTIGRPGVLGNEWSLGLATHMILRSWGL